MRGESDEKLKAAKPLSPRPTLSDSEMLYFQFYEFDEKFQRFQNLAGVKINDIIGKSILSNLRFFDLLPLSRV
jgi:hypothetical protein